MWQFFRYCFGCKINNGNSLISAEAAWGRRTKQKCKTLNTGRTKIFK